jgi:class 3 adenylate cyclase
LHSAREEIRGETDDVWRERLMTTGQNHTQLAILFADISGSTALYDKLGNELALRLISRTLGILKREMDAQQGTLIKTIGDEIMCTFPSATAAINAARAMQAAIEEQPPVSGQHTYVRIGLHVGDVIQDDGDIFGDAVNVAARVAAITRARQILTTQAVVDMLPDDLRSKARQIMRTELRGKDESLTIFLILWEKDDTVNTRIGMSAFRKPAESLSRHELLLRYHDQVLTVNDQMRSVLLGRESDCNVVIRNKLASRQHALIEYNFGKFLLTDHSVNGTYIRFSDNQVVQLNHQQIVLHGAGQISCGQSFSEAPTDVVEYIMQ